MMVLRGKAWVYRESILFDRVLPEQYWKGGSQQEGLNVDELGRHAMEGVDPHFALEARSGKYAFVVAGSNFGGGGKSIEHPVLALKGAGVKAVIVESCSRYFFRNAINNGLPILICEGITEQVKNGDELEVNVSTGEILNVTTGLRFPSNPLPENLIEILNLGGYIPYTRKKMKSLTKHGSLSD